MVTAAAANAALHEPLASLRLIADQAFSRAAGAPLVPGNRIRLLRNAEENYPAWFESIQDAKRTIHFESYIIRDDKVGYEFADLLGQKAREGVRVQLIYDWLGSRGTSSRFWRRLRESGVEVRCFNPPRVDSTFGWLSRDHRKFIAVDGRIGFVSGLCVGQSWIGDPRRKIEAWRDTGVEIEGPAMPDLEKAFSQIWNLLGSADLSEEPPVTTVEGNVALRILAEQPSVAGLYRLDHLVAAFARHSIWLTDAYFLGTPSYVQGLRAAAHDGVDVRLLLPRTSDIPIVRSLSRVGYRALLESGVRVFEWNGPMLHAKTAVVDGRWARVGSTNLNVTSWLGNYELDVFAEDEEFAEKLEQMYLDDLDHSTEIVLHEKHHVSPKERRKLPPRGSAHASAGRAATGVLTIGTTVGAAITRPQLLGSAEAPVVTVGGLMLLVIVFLAIFVPHAISVPVGILCAWGAVAFLIKAFRLRFRAKK